MKTTIEIPDQLAAEAKSTARQHGTTLRELVVTGLRAEVERRDVVGPVDFHFPTVAGNGLVADLTPDQVIARSYGMDV